MTTRDAQTNLFGQASREDLALGNTDKVVGATGLPACPRGNNDPRYIFINGIAEHIP
jgi:hypothetical protein